MCDSADLAVEINRRVLLAKLRLRRYGLSLYDQSMAPLQLKIRMLKAEFMETMLNGCVTWSPTVAHLAILRTAHHRLLLRCIGWKKKRRGLSRVVLRRRFAKTGCENVESTVRKRRTLSRGSWSVSYTHLTLPTTPYV